MPENTNRPSDEEQFDCSPWASTSRSSRVRAYRYDHANDALQVLWKNRPSSGYGYLYENVSYEEYRSFARAASLGKRINDPLTYGNFSYRPMSSQEENAPSNDKRRGLTSRTKDDVNFNWENPSG